MDINKESKIYVAGHSGMVGSAILRLLKKEGYNNLIYKNHSELDLLNQNEVYKFYKRYKPEYVFICAAKVGGIHANNTMRAQFLYENLQIQNNLIHFAYKTEVKKLLFLGSSCIYPRDCKQPIKESYLLTGPLENTNEPYAIAKIAGIKMCENYFKQYGCDFFSIMPTNIYGPNDNYDLENSHVFPALLRKFHEAKVKENDKVVIWGSGKPLREFIYVDDVADAAIFTMKVSFKRLYKNKLSYLNVGSGDETSIKNLALLISKELKFKGRIIFDLDKPDGTPRKIIDSSIINKLGWESNTPLLKGLKETYELYVKSYNN